MENWGKWVRLIAKLTGGIGYGATTREREGEKAKSTIKQYRSNQFMEEPLELETNLGQRERVVTFFIPF